VDASLGRGASFILTGASSAPAISAVPDGGSGAKELGRKRVCRCTSSREARTTTIAGEPPDERARTMPGAAGL